MGFYAHLPSNANPDLYNENKTSHFKIEFSKRMELYGKWQIALIELHYPNTIQNVREGHNYIKVFTALSHTSHAMGSDTMGPAYDVAGAVRDVTIRTVEETFCIPPRYYATPQMLLTAINELMTPIDNSARPKTFVSVTPEGVVEIPAYDTSFTFEFAPTLAHQLGLQDPGPYRSDARVKGCTVIDLSLGVPTQLFLYIDIISDQIVGHMRAPLLRTVPTETTARFGTTSHYHCEHPLYFDLVTKSFDSVEISIRDTTGKLIPFTYGTSSLLVHFRENAE